MPKNTFLNLSLEKKARILDALKEVFSNRPYYAVQVKTIVALLEMARGSFYQYFEDLEDAYFTILERETVDIHQLFLRIFMEQDAALYPALTAYGEKLAEILFQNDTHQLYKHRYLYWDESLNRHWNRRHPEPAGVFFSTDGHRHIDAERIQFIKAVVHSLIERVFRENWTPDFFLAVYRQHMDWLRNGVD